MNSPKPRLKRYGWGWICIGRNRYATGMTAKSAYDNWDAARKRGYWSPFLDTSMPIPSHQTAAVAA